MNPIVHVIGVIDKKISCVEKTVDEWWKIKFGANI